MVERGERIRKGPRRVDLTKWLLPAEAVVGVGCLLTRTVLVFPGAVLTLDAARRAGFFSRDRKK